MFDSKSEIQDKLAKSLTAETTDLLPFLPYLLQDLWELGSNPSDIVTLIQKHIFISEKLILLDLACGKGAVSIMAAQVLKVKVKGVDIIPEFIQYAEEKASESGVKELCQFVVEDINQSVERESGFDCVIFGAVGDVLGGPQETLKKLKKVIKPQGYIIMDEAYLKDYCENAIKYQNYEYFTYEQWLEIFDKTGLTIVDSVINKEEELSKNDYNTRAIINRVDELIEQYPQQKKLFKDYIQSQKKECDDLENSLIGVTWLLQKK